MVEIVFEAGSFDFIVPGFEASQAIHCVCFASFCNRQESQFHAPSGFLNLSPNPLVCSTLLFSSSECGLAVLQQGQTVTELLFLTRHPEHSQESLLGLNLFIISETLFVVFCVTVFSVPARFNFCADDSTAMSIFFDFGFKETGFDSPQQGHLLTSAQFLSKQPEHSHDPSLGLNFSIRSSGF
jgi:hypothetical protein